MNTTLTVMIALSVGVAFGFFLAALLTANKPDAHMDESDIGFMEHNGLGIVKMRTDEPRWALVDQSVDPTKVIAIGDSVRSAVEIAREQMFNEAVEESRKNLEGAVHG